MNVNDVRLEATAVKASQYPDADTPEIAFAGRSNVGKSSLINAMINRKALARASSSPGKTRVINFYNVENVLRFVDLPGYGYARVSREISGSWGGMIESYLKGRASLKGVVLVLDLRRVPSEDDLLMYNWLKCYDIHVITAVTKADKVKRSAIRKNAENARQRLELAESEPLVVFSSETKAGKNELWSLIEDSISFN